MEPDPTHLAADIAHQSHQSQTGRDGQPYISHPKRVTTRLRRAGLDSRIVAAGWLHDILEDTTYPHAELAGRFDKATVDTIDAATRRPAETYSNFIRRVATHPWGSAVKIADLLDHLEPSRRSALPPGNLKRYHKALADLADQLLRHVDTHQLPSDAMNLWVDAQIRLDELDGYPAT